MADNNNLVVVEGRLSGKPEAKTTTNGKKYVRFSVAAERAYKTQAQQADFVPCVAWDKAADRIEKFFDKGKFIRILGHITTGNYIGKDGNKVYTFGVTVDSWNFAPRDKSDSQTSPAQEPQTDGPAVTNPQTQAEFIPMESDIEIPFE